MKFAIQKLLKPNRIDAWILVLTFLLTAAILFPITLLFLLTLSHYALQDWFGYGEIATWVFEKLDFFYEPLVLPLAVVGGLLVGGWIALAANLGQLRISVKSRLSILLVLAASFLLLIQSARLNRVDQSVLHEFMADESDFFFSPGRFSVLIGGTILLAILFPLAQLALQACQSKWKALKISRAKVLIAIAAVLGGSVLARDFFFPPDAVGPIIAPLADIEMSAWVVGIYAGLGLLGIGIIPHLMLRSQKSFGKRVLLTGGYFLILSAGLGAIISLQFELESSIPIGLTALTIVAMIFLVNAAIPITKPRTENDEAETTAKPGWIWLPSLWSVVPLAVLLSCGWINYQYDINTLVIDESDAQWQRARKVRQITRSLPNGSVFIDDSGRFGLGIGIFAPLPDDVDSDFLKALDQLDASVHLRISNHQSNVEYSYLNSIITVRIDDGEITTTQLAQLMPPKNQTLFCYLGWHDEETAGTVLKVMGEPIKWQPPATILIDRISPGDLAKLFHEKTILTGQRIHLAPTLRLNADDMRALGRLTTQCEVTVYSDQLPSVWDPAEIKIGHFDKLRIIFTDNPSPVGWRLIFRTNATIIWHFENVDNRIFWDISFAARGRGVPYSSNAINRVFQRPDIAQALNDANLLFPADPGNPAELDGVFLPHLEPVLIPKIPEVLPELKVLGLDRNWVYGLKDRTFSPEYEWWNESPDLSSLGKLSQLEELYLPHVLQRGDVAFLQKLKQLKVLQINADVFNLSPLPFPLSRCPSLEHLILFNAPDARLVGEIKNLPNLKRLTIFDMDFKISMMANPVRQKFDQQFGNVKVEVIEPGTFMPNKPNANSKLTFQQQLRRSMNPQKRRSTVFIPESFEKHADRVQKQLREKHQSRSEHGKDKK